MKIAIASDHAAVGLKAELAEKSATLSSLEARDKAIRDQILSSLKAETWTHTGLLNVTVSNGIVDLWGVADSDAERKAIRVAAESAAGVGAVHDHLVTYRGGGWA